MGGCVMWVRLGGLELSTRGSVVHLAMFIYVVFGTANDDAKGWVIASLERTVKSILELTTQDRCECLPNQRSCISTPSSTHCWEPAKDEANEKEEITKETGKCSEFKLTILQKLALSLYSMIAIASQYSDLPPSGKKNKVRNASNFAKMLNSHH